MNRTDRPLDSKAIKQGALMAYKLTKIEPVAFGEKEIEPELDAEKKLRLGRIQYTGGADAEKKADEIIASCFPNDEAFVLEYLAKCPTPAKSRLVAYLIGGEETVKAVERAYEQQLAEKLTKGGLENA